MKKLAVICLPGLETFLMNLIPFFQSKYIVRSCFSNKEEEIREVIGWADIVWLEWANELAVALTNSKLLDDKRVICRLHSYEALSGYVRGINWAKIDDLIFVAKHVRDLVFQQIAVIPNINVKDFNVHIIPNGIDVDKFKFSSRDPGKNIAFVGNFSFKKGPMLLIHVFQALVESLSQKEYHLYIAGKMDDPRAGLYLSHMINELELNDFIHFDGFVKDIPSWLEDKNYIICTSPFESQNLGVMEAMASGLKPLIHNFVGAKDVYDEKYIWTTISDFIAMIKSRRYNSSEYRRFVSKKYLLCHRLREIQKLIDTPSTPKKKDTLHYEQGIRDYDEYDYWNRRDYPTSFNMLEETTRRHIDYIKKHVKGAKKVLDFGPGIGRTFEAYEGVELLEGVDISALYDARVRDAAIRYGFTIASANPPSKNNRVFNLKHITMQDLDSLPYEDKAFDVAVASEVLLHQKPENIMKVMKELIRVAKEVVAISWMVDNVAFDSPGVLKPGPNHCFHYNYPEICKENNWEISDVVNIERQIYFVYTDIVG